MNKKIKVTIVAGGTGGHVLPGCNLAQHLEKNKFEVQVVTDKRGAKFTKSFHNLNFSILPSKPIISKNIITIFLSLSHVIYSIFRSLVFLFTKRPSIVFGMGGYASFPICIAAKLLNIRFIIYENNLIVGKANKYLAPFAVKIFVSSKQLKGIPLKHKNKIIEIGNIIKKDFITFSDKNIHKKNDKKISLLVLGGSQAAEVFAEILPKIFIKCHKEKIPLKIFQQCLPTQDQKLQLLYKNANLDFETFNFSNNLIRYFSKANLAITRSGSSVLAELTNCNIPFISIPLPSSADNHQLENAIYYEKKNLGFLLEEKDIEKSLFSRIKSIYENNSTLKGIEKNQRQYSDKNVYENINKELREIINEH